MPDKINITEKDIFNFVFFNTILSKEKKEYLNNNPIFKVQLDFYKKLKEILLEEIPNNIKEKIASGIDAYKKIKTFVLYPVDYGHKKKHSDVLILAADSLAAESNEIQSKTFIDEGKNYLIRLIKENSKSKIYVFSTHETVMKNFTVVIKPQSVKYVLNDNSKPLEIEGNIDPESIEIEF